MPAIKDKEDRRQGGKRLKHCRSERSHKRKESKKKRRHIQDRVSSSSTSSDEENKDVCQRSDSETISVNERNPNRHHRRHHHHNQHGGRRDKKHSKKTRRKTPVSADEDSSSRSSDNSDGQTPLKKRRSKKHRKKSHRKNNDREYHRDKSSKKCRKPTASKKSIQFASTLQSLLRHHLALSKELPYLLIRLASGSGLNLRSMEDMHASSALTKVFKAMGCALNSATDCWEWKCGEDLEGLLNSDEKSLLLVKMAKCLLDEVGVTMDTINEFEKIETNNKQETTSNESLVQDRGCSQTTITATVDEKKDTQTGEIALLTTMLLDKFNDIHQNTGNSSKSSLAKEIFCTATMILDGESICLDAIPNDRLKKSLETLFLAIGLTKEEMIEEEDEDEKSQSDEEEGKKNGKTEKIESAITYGYTLPEEVATEGYLHTKMKLDAVISACKFRHQNILRSQSKKRVLGPAIPLPSNTRTDSKIESDSDDDGPVPLGSKKLAKKIPTIPSSNERKRGQEISHAENGDGERESWMLEPGEHDFLKGIMASGVIKNRKFQNKKTQGRYDKASGPMQSSPLDPKVQSEVNGILKAHAQARGPSLLEQHRENKMRKDADSSAKTEWGWSRDKDLDRDRRVDKQHLSMVMGGASQELKDKFQGGFSRSFM